MSARRDPSSVRPAVAVYGTLARLLPYDARARWGDEQTACFTELARAAHERRGAVRVAVVLLRSTGDLLLRLPREHVRNGAVGTAFSELRYAVRSLLRSPGFTAASVLTLGLGLAAALSVFTLVYGVLLKPLPYGEPDRLVELDHPLQPVPRAGRGRTSADRAAARFGSVRAPHRHGPAARGIPPDRDGGSRRERPRLARCGHGAERGAGPHPTAARGGARSRARSCRRRPVRAHRSGSGFHPRTTREWGDHAALS